jgi:hypothetical protein
VLVDKATVVHIEIPRNPKNGDTVFETRSVEEYLKARVGPFDPIGHSRPASFPQRLQRMREPEDGTVGSSGQSSILTARSWPQCWQVANKPRLGGACRRASSAGSVPHP